MIFLKKIFYLGVAGCLCIWGLAGCSGRDSAQAVHELRFSLDGILEVTISYDEESVTFVESGGGEMVVREYMSENRSAYQAKIERSGNRLHISGGGGSRYSQAAFTGILRSEDERRGRRREKETDVANGHRLMYNL